MPSLTFRYKAVETVIHIGPCCVMITLAAISAMPTPDETDKLLNT